MINATHTPGPWHRGSDAGNGRDGIFADDGRMRMEDRGTTLYPVAQVVTGYESREDDANARLIAAAPDLLAALKDVLYLSTGIPDSESSYLANAALVKVRAAIEKATQ